MNERKQCNDCLIDAQGCSAAHSNFCRRIFQNTLYRLFVSEKRRKKKKRIKIESAKSKVLLRRNKYYDITIASSWQRTATYSIRVCVCVCVYSIRMQIEREQL